MRHFVVHCPIPFPCLVGLCTAALRPDHGRCPYIPEASTLTGMSTESSNGLAHASSAYLRSAMHQPIRWYEWGAEAFATAERENKPMLLDIGAVWCHWCHVMDRESYEDSEIAQLINERFVAVKVDRDERPDVDSRHQLDRKSVV